MSNLPVVQESVTKKSSMFEIPLNAANLIYTLSNAALTSGALCVLLGTVGVFWSGGIRERYSDERIARNEAETASANARAAEAEKGTAEARLKLAQITTPRHLKPEQIEKLTGLLLAGAKGKVVVRGRWPDEEALSLGTQINGIISGAGFEVIETPTSQRILSLGNIGANIIVNDTNNMPPAASATYKAFKAIGFDMPARSDPATVPEKDIFWIMIGSRY
ncbi:MAG: hypothetical protein ACRYF2_19030 [Janthinobacterium lividum]